MPAAKRKQARRKKHRPSTALASATDFDCLTPAGTDDFYTARAANQQPDQAGCRVVVHRKLAGVDDLYYHFATPPERSPAVAHAIKAPAPPLP